MSTLSGQVEDESGKPLSHAAVMMVGSGDSALTADDGRFVLHVASGAYILAVRRLGFRAERFAVSLAPGEQRDLTVVESHAALVLPTVTTTAQERKGYRAVGFDQRMKLGVGHFLTYEQIQHRHATRLAQLLDQMPGIYVSIADPKSFDYSVQGTHGIASCVGYLVDGVPQTQIPPTIAHRADGADFLMDPSAVGAIEVYNPAERPAQFGPGLMERAPPVTGDAAPSIDIDAQQCTLVVIWTRARLGLTEDPPEQAASRPADGDAPQRAVAPGDITHGVAAFASDASCKSSPAADTVDLAVYATIEGSPPAPMSDSTWSNYKGQVLTALDRSAALPSVIVLPAFGLPFSTIGTDGRHLVHEMDATPTLSNVIEFTLDQSGGLIDAHVAASSLSGSADTTALAMVERAAAAHAFPTLPTLSEQKPATHLYLLVASIEPAVGTRAAVLGELEVPAWHLTRAAHLIGPDQRDSSSRTDNGATVALEAVVDEAGRVVPGTTRLIGNLTSDASRDLSARMSQLQFEPALIGTCPVSELVLQPLITGR